MGEMYLPIAKVGLFFLIILLIILRVTKTKIAGGTDISGIPRSGSISDEQERYLLKDEAHNPHKASPIPGFFSPTFIFLLGILSLVAGSMGGCWLSTQMDLTGEEGLGKMILLTVVGGITALVAVPLTIYVGVLMSNKLFTMGKKVTPED